MTIDKCIEYFFESYAFEAIEDGVYDEAKHHNEVLDYTIDTLRKYQKIKEIVQDYKDEYDRRILGEDAWSAVKEIIDDNK